MQTLFECTVRYSKPVEGTDQQKRVSEVYLFDALTYTEAEKRAYEKLPELIQGEFQVTSIRKARYAEVIPNEEGGYWYKVKISFILIDENSGKEISKKQNKYNFCKLRRLKSDTCDLKPALCTLCIITCK